MSRHHDHRCRTRREIVRKVRKRAVPPHRHACAGARALVEQESCDTVVVGATSHHDAERRLRRRGDRCWRVHLVQTEWGGLRFGHEPHEGEARDVGLAFLIRRRESHRVERIPVEHRLIAGVVDRRVVQRVVRPVEPVHVELRERVVVPQLRLAVEVIEQDRLRRAEWGDPMSQVVAIDNEAAPSRLLDRAGRARVVHVARRVHGRDRHHRVERDDYDRPHVHDPLKLRRKRRCERREAESADDHEEVRHRRGVDPVYVVVARRHVEVRREHVGDHGDQGEAGTERLPETPWERQQDDEHWDRERRKSRELGSDELDLVGVPELRTIHPKDRSADAERERR